MDADKRTRLGGLYRGVRKPGWPTTREFLSDVEDTLVRKFPNPTPITEDKLRKLIDEAYHEELAKVRLQNGGNPPRREAPE